MNINDILPAKKEVMPAPHKFINTHEDYCEGYNACVDDCAAAIERANLVCCPTEEEIVNAFVKFCKTYSSSPCCCVGGEPLCICDMARVTMQAKALLAMFNSTEVRRDLVVCPSLEQVMYVLCGWKEGDSQIIYDHWVPMAKALLALMRSVPQGDNDLKPYDAKEC